MGKSRSPWLSAHPWPVCSVSFRLQTPGPRRRRRRSSRWGQLQLREAGRWQGNSLNFTGTRDGTDRAARCTLGIFCSYDATA